MNFNKIYASFKASIFNYELFSGRRSYLLAMLNFLAGIYFKIFTLSSEC